MTLASPRARGFEGCGDALGRCEGPGRVASGDVGAGIVLGRGLLSQGLADVL